jgi:hypothetical protein
MKNVVNDVWTFQVADAIQADLDEFQNAEAHFKSGTITEGQFRVIRVSLDSIIPAQRSSQRARSTGSQPFLCRRPGGRRAVVAQEPGRVIAFRIRRQMNLLATVPTEPFFKPDRLTGPPEGCVKTEIYCEHRKLLWH